MKKIYTCTALLFILLNAHVKAQCPVLVWSDEFNGTTLDLSKWTTETGAGGWGNNELEYYKAANATVSNGTLKITAKMERVQSSSYTSARIKTATKGDWTYGRFEARIKLPKGAGLWPAFWMMPTDSYYGTWPKSGEMDIAELIGSKPTNSFGTIHYGTSSTDHQSKGQNFYLNSGTYADSFHVFVLEWQAGVIKEYVDDNLYNTVTISDIAPYNWPFDKRFYIILNLAVGGTLGGTPDNTIFPATMEVDYVRVYSANKPTMSGQRVVANRAQGITYSIADATSGATFNWVVPSGATIASGQGTNTITVNWGATTTAGNVTCAVNSSCGGSSIAMNVAVEPPYSYGFTFVNSDSVGKASLTSSTGTYTTVSNPSASGINTSALSVKYVRNSTQQYDNIVYTTSAITNAADYKTKAKKFYMDVYTAAPIGTPILLQLENSSLATSSNYPTGRNSRYIGNTTKQNQWERIVFSLLDIPDANTSDASVNHLLVLCNSNSTTGDTYYIDNFDSYTAATGVAATQFANPVLIDNNTIKELTVKVSPNPTSSQFSLKLNSNDLTSSISLKIVDASGHEVDAFNNLSAGNTVYFGNTYSSGVYYAQVFQKQQYKIVKLNKVK